LKKIVIWILILAFVSTMALFGAGCKQQVAEETTAAETTAAATTVAETTAAETIVAETVEEIAPFILEAREGLEPFRSDLTFQGELGQTPTWDTDLTLTVSEVEKIKEGKYTAVFNPNGFQGDHTNVMIKAINDAFSKMNMELIAVTDSQNDPAKQISDIETMLALKPDVVITGPIDPVSSAEVYRKVIDSGAKLVIWSNVPQGFEHGKDYVGVVTANAQGLAQFCVSVLADNISTNAEVGMMFFDVKFWIVNLIDKIVEDTLKNDYPNLNLVAKSGYTDPYKAIDVASAMLLQNPNIEGIYGEWNLAAMGAADACKVSNKPDVKITCFGVDRPTLINIIDKGNIVGTVSDNPYHLGFNLALLAGYGVIDKPAPEYTIAPSVPITLENLQEAWELTTHTALPDEVLQELMKKGM
jgi:ribose transport system substrate-binding protein